MHYACLKSVLFLCLSFQSAKLGTLDRCASFTVIAVMVNATVQLVNAMTVILITGALDVFWVFLSSVFYYINCDFQ
jgi:hypothetical protein